MRWQLVLVACVVFVGGCDVAIKNGLFACGQPSDCPSGYHCWSADNRCYDTKEPECEPRSCDQVISEFASLGITIECGSLPDGCDGEIECGSCPEGTTCGANGQNFVCGCEEVTCASADAECGQVATRCGSEPGFIDCNDCVGEGIECTENRCVCPPGQNCDDACGGRCVGEERCVDGACCVPSFPCVQNDCSPPGGLPNGCGGVAHCPTCQADQECVFGDDLRFECLGDCTCEARGIECGNATICGSPTPCGTCQDNGYGDEYRCDAGRCTCEDQYEGNDSPINSRLVCSPELPGWNCMQEAWSVDLQATLHDVDDVDYYRLEVMDSYTPIVAQTYAGEGQRILQLGYQCPNGENGMVGCSGDVYDIGGFLFCSSPGDVVGIERWCESKTGAGVGRLVVGILPDDYVGECAEYGLKIVATFGIELPDD